MYKKTTMIFKLLKMKSRLSSNRSVGFLPNKIVGLFALMFLLYSTGLSAKDFTSDPISDESLMVAPMMVKGNIQDTDGLTLIGVSILVEGTSIGTVTDIDGNYSLQVPDENSTLVYSYTGYTTVREDVSSRAIINLVMETDDQLLDEVVVIGYGTVKKSNLTGAVASLDGKELTSVAAGNPTSALQGKISGVQIESNGAQPGGAANVFIRGVSSLTNSFPLYVIDGTFADNMNYLNPKDIDRIEVLKDAASAAIYGSRAANGVVIISTKRGKAGAPRVSLDMRGGTEAPDNYLDFLTGSEFITYRNQREANDGTGRVLVDEGVNTDWQDLSLNTGGIQDYGLSVSGGSENAKYFVSGNFYQQEGILISTGFERINFRANTEFTLGKFKVQQSLGITQSEFEDNVWFGRDGSSTAPILRESAPENEGGFEAPEADELGFAGQNKYGLATLEEHLETDRKIFGNVNVSYEIVEGLVAKINLGADLLNRHNFAFRPTYFMSTSDAVDNLNDLNDLTEIRSEENLTLFEPTLSYGKDMGAGRLDVVVGYTRQKVDFRSAGAYAENTPTNGIRVLSAAPPSNVMSLLGLSRVSGLISQFGRVNYSHQGKYLISATLRRDGSSKFAEDVRWGIFPSASVGWNVSSEDFWNTNTVNNLKIRAGYGELGSQNIPDFAYQNVINLNSNTSFGGSPAAGYSQTSLALQDLTWEVAKTFNVGIDVGVWKDKLTFTAEYYNKNVEDVLVAVNLPSTVGFSQPVIQNVGEFNNSGIELEGLYRINVGNVNLNIGGNINFISSKITSLPNTITGPSITEDLVVANRFIEGEAPGVYWGFVTDGVYANQSEIDNDTNLMNDPDRKAIVQPGDFRRVDLNGDGIVNGDDQQILGDPTPTFTYGLNLGGEISGFDFGLFFQGVEGNEIYNVTRYYNIFWADDNKLAEVKDAWTETNTDTEIPRTTTADAAQNGAPSSFFVEDGSYFRLRTAEIGYNITTSGVEWLNNARVFLTGQNLITLTQYTGYNPDISSVNGGRSSNSPFFGVPSTVNPLLGRGLDVRAYPNSRSIIVGIQLGF